VEQAETLGSDSGELSSQGDGSGLSHDLRRVLVSFEDAACGSPLC